MCFIFKFTADFFCVHFYLGLFRTPNEVGICTTMLPPYQNFYQSTCYFRQGDLGRKRCDFLKKMSDSNTKYL